MPRLVRRSARGVSAALALAAGLSARSAPAEQPLRLAVERGPGAETCPNESELVSLVERVRGAPAASGAGEYRVRFARSETGFEVTIASADDASERSLDDRGETCTALARATAVTLALLLDVERSAPADDPPEQSRRDVARVAPVPVPLPDTARDVTREPRWVGLELGAAALVGVLRPVAPAASGGIDFGAGAFRAGAGALWAPETELELGVGAVNPSLLGITLEGCYAPLRSRLRLELCTGLVAALVRGEAHGFTRDSSRTRPWFSVPVGLSFGVAPAPLGLRVGLSLLVPIRRQDFQVDGAGVAYESWPVAALFQMRGAAALPW
jgi:hypothetical protein